MKLKKVVSKKTGRVGFRARCLDPLTGQRTQQTFWVAERADAELAFQKFMSNRGKRAYNLPAETGWQLPYGELVERFLKDSGCSVGRTERLRECLTRNPLNIAVCGEFSTRGALTVKCRALAVKHGEVYVNGGTIQPLKQLSAWAAASDIIPHDPLRDWKKLPRKTPMPHKRAFSPEEMRAIFQASDEMDALNYASFPLSTVFKTLLLTGNRPGAVTDAKIGDFDGRRVVLPPGCGKKNNGVATVPPAFVAELKQYFLKRGRPGNDKLLLVTGSGTPLDASNLRYAFKRAALLAFVKMCWPQNDPRTEFAKPLEVALSLYLRRPMGFDGAPPTTDEGKALRAKRKAAVAALTEALKPAVEKLMAGRPVYALRHTHITWARRFANFDAVRAQVGHAGRNIEEQHYNDAQFVDAGQSSQAVWDVLIGAKILERVEHGQNGAFSNQNATVNATAEKNGEIDAQIKSA